MGETYLHTLGGKRGLGGGGGGAPNCSEHPESASSPLWGKSGGGKILSGPLILEAGEANSRSKSRLKVFGKKSGYFPWKGAGWREVRGKMHLGEGA